jgi:hypothetical protein
MGTWGHLPWDNDSAADWFGDTFEKTRLAQRVEEALKLSVDDSAEEIRAAAAIVLMLGRVYVWPIKDLDRHLALAADRLEEVIKSGTYAEAPEIETLITSEIEELRSRVKDRRKDLPKPLPPKRWWEFWK